MCVPGSPRRRRRPTEEVLPGLAEAHDKVHRDAAATAAQAAGDDMAHHEAAGGGAQAADVEMDVKIVGASLRSHTGARVNFADDVVADRLVAITLFYTSCTTVCPISNAIFAQVQERLGGRLDRDVRLVSLTVDPSTDTPERLARHARRHGSREGWWWLTGEKMVVDRVLDGLNAFTADYTQHPVVVIVGDPVSGEWSRLFGFPDPSLIMQRLDALAAARARLSLKAEEQ